MTNQTRRLFAMSVNFTNRFWSFSGGNGVLLVNEGIRRFFMAVNKVSSRILINKKDYGKMINPTKKSPRCVRLSQLDNYVTMISPAKRS